MLRENERVLVAVLLFIVAFALGMLIWWLSRLQLKVEFNAKYIKFKMSPVHMNKKVLLWKDIKRFGIIETSEAAQWSGGNITLRQEKRISLTGRNGLALKTKQGAYFLIGCQDIDKLKHALEKLEKE